MSSALKNTTIPTRVGGYVDRLGEKFRHKPERLTTSGTPKASLTTAKRQWRALIMATRKVGPLAPIANSANAIVARALVHKIMHHKAAVGSLEWKTFAQDEIRLALDAASQVLSRESLS